MKREQGSAVPQHRLGWVVVLSRRLKQADGALLITTKAVF